MADSFENGSLTVVAHPNGDVLCASMSGPFTLGGAKRAFLEVLDGVTENNTAKVLIDGRKVNGEPTMIERFFYGDFAADQVQKLNPNRARVFAYVLHEPVLDPMRLGETVAVNRGMNVKVFDDFEDALAWLGVPPPFNNPASNTST